VSVARVKFRCNILISGKIIKRNAGFGSEWDTLYFLIELEIPGYVRNLIYMFHGAI